MVKTFHKEEVEKIACERRVFKIVGDQKLDMIVCYPKLESPKGCILFIHGGRVEERFMREIKTSCAIRGAKRCYRHKHII